MNRQFSGLELIASENYTSRAVMEACGSILTNKYSEGLPGARYYGGNEIVDVLENLCRDRALKAFNLDPKDWGVNVQPYSGTTANFAAFTALLQPGERLMGLDLPSGGHLTHGYQTEKKKISSSAIYFDSKPYFVSPSTGLIDYDSLAASAKEFKPKLLICGASAYPREWNYAKLREIADEVGALLLADVAHISGLIAAGEAANCFEFADVVTTTTHKTLRGPRAAMIFFRKTNQSLNLEERINFAVFPSCQGGPHQNTIAGIATALAQVDTADFKLYAKQIRANAKALATSLQRLGYKLVTDGTDNHLLLVDLRSHKITGNKVEKICDLVHITINKNSIYGDKSAAAPAGIRLGTAALTTRGLKEEDFDQVAQFIHEAIELALRVQNSCGSKLYKDFVGAIGGVEGEIGQLKGKIEKFSRSFPMPGYESE